MSAKRITFYREALPHATESQPRWPTEVSFVGPFSPLLLASLWRALWLPNIVRARLLLQLNEKHPVQELRQCGLLLGISAPKPAQRVGNFNILGPRQAVGDFLLGYARSSIATSHSSSIPAHRSQLQSTRLPFLPASLLYFNLCDLKEKREREREKKTHKKSREPTASMVPMSFMTWQVGYGSDASTTRAFTRSKRRCYQKFCLPEGPGGLDRLILCLG